MSGQPRLLAIIPALNERDALPNVVREVREANPGADVLVIDDGSTDDTAARAPDPLTATVGAGGARIACAC